MSSHAPGACMCMQDVTYALGPSPFLSEQDQYWQLNPNWRMQRAAAKWKEIERPKSLVLLSNIIRQGGRGVEAGENVWAKQLGREGGVNWYAAKVCKRRGDGKCDLEFCDGTPNAHTHTSVHMCQAHIYPHNMHTTCTRHAHALHLHTPCTRAALAHLHTHALAHDMHTTCTRPALAHALTSTHTHLYLLAFQAKRRGKLIPSTSW